MSLNLYASTRVPAQVALMRQPAQSVLQPPLDVILAGAAGYQVFVLRKPVRKTSEQ